jgi:asparagine synthase (glutamine-hydrolysing)
MPGLSLWWRQDSLDEAQAGRLGAALEGLRHGPDYEVRVLASGRPFFLGWAAYPGYPLEIIDTELGPVYFEGRLFGPSPAERRAELTRLAQALSQGRLTQAAAFLRESDGEFIFLFHDRTQAQVFILNDRFGLLPGYSSAGPGRFLFTREPRFFLLAGGSPQLDRPALAEYLVFAYPLGDKTLFADLTRLPPASLLSLDLVQGQVRVQPLAADNAEEEAHAHLSPEQNARNLLDLHDQACARRATVMAETTNYLGLTGGYDSRAACLGLVRAEVKFRAFTFDFAFQPNTSDDVDLAGRLAQAYGLTWRRVAVGEIKGRDFLRLLGHKCGLNFLGQSFILRLLEEFQAEAGGACQYVTGDVGLSLMDAAPPDQAWTRPSQLLAHLLNHEGFFTPAQAESLTGHPAARLKARLLALLESYPERSLARKYSHFRNYHRVFKWHYEGLDRNRGVDRKSVV